MTTVRNSNTFICDAASVVDQRPFTPLPSQTAPHPLVEASVVTTTQRDTMPIVPDAARNQGVLQIVRVFLHLKYTITLRCLSVTALSLRDRYHIWNGRIRNIPSGSAIAADVIIPNR